MMNHYQMKNAGNMSEVVPLSVSGAEQGFRQKKGLFRCVVTVL